MKLFKYTMRIYSEDTVGVVQANNIIHAKQILSMIYSDWNEADTKVSEVEFDSRGLCEIFYG